MASREHYRIVDADFYDRHICGEDEYASVEEAEASMGPDSLYSDRMYVVRVVETPLRETVVSHAMVSRDLL